jgi:hypothetical protein
MGSFPELCREWQHVWKGTNDAKIYNDQFVNYLTWIWNEWVSRTYIEGVYMDDAFNRPVYDHPSPVTYLLPDGEVQPGFQWRGHREAIKRMRQVLWDNGKVPHMCVHMTHTYFVPYMSFFDVILDGEDHYAVPPREKDFIDMWTMDRMRFMNQAKWGQTTTWLGWRTAGELPRQPTPQWSYRQQRAFDTALILTDLIWARHHYDMRCFDQDWLREAKWRLDPDVVFHPYWDLRGLAKPTSPDVAVSAWTREGRCLVIIANLGQTDIEAAVALDPRAMGFGDTPLADLVRTDVDPTLLVYFDAPPIETPEIDPADITGEALDLELDAPPTLEERRAVDPRGAHTIRDGRLELPVRPHDYRLIEFTR